MAFRNKPGCCCGFIGCETCNAPNPWQMDLGDLVLAKDGVETRRVTGGSFLIVPFLFCQWAIISGTPLCLPGGFLDPQPYIRPGIKLVDFNDLLRVEVGWFSGGITDMGSLVSGYYQDFSPIGLPAPCDRRMSFTANLGIFPSTYNISNVRCNDTVFPEPTHQGLQDLEITLEPPPA